MNVKIENPPASPLLKREEGTRRGVFMCDVPLWVCIYIYISTYICMYTYVYIYLYIYVHICVHICYIYTSVYTSVFTSVFTSIYTSIHICTYTHLYVYIHIYTHMRTHICTYHHQKHFPPQRAILQKQGRKWEIIVTEWSIIFTGDWFRAILCRVVKKWVIMISSPSSVAHHPLIFNRQPKKFTHYRWIKSPTSKLKSPAEKHIPQNHPHQKPLESPSENVSMNNIFHCWLNSGDLIKFKKGVFGRGWCLKDPSLPHSAPLQLSTL